LPLAQALILPDSIVRGFYFSLALDISQFHKLIVHPFKNTNPPLRKPATIGGQWQDKGCKGELENGLSWLFADFEKQVNVSKVFFSFGLV
jgi:hypothetical protein